MDFSRLPDNAFLKILKYLPLEECVRSGRVNKSFRRMAQLATSQTKSLNLSEHRFRKLTSDQLAVLLDVCSPNLERIKFGGRFISDNDWQQLVTKFAQYECPRLIDIYLGYIPINQEVFEQMIRNNQNVETLVWRNECTGFPAITNHRLTKLHLHVCTDASLQSLIGYCPNLEEMVLYESGGNDPISPDGLDKFFASIPHAQRITINFGSIDANDFEKEKLINFYRLDLTNLTIKFDTDHYPGNRLVSKVVTSFSHLRELDLGDVEPTNEGIASLATLRDLEVLQLQLSEDREPYDQGFRQLAQCRKLRDLIVSKSTMASGTLVHLLRYCSQLKFVEIYDITEVESPEAAAVILGSLGGTAKRDIIIRFIWKNETFESVWKGAPAKAAIKELEEDDGVKIRIG